MNLKKNNEVAILFSADSANAISYMPFSDRVDYTTVLQQMYDALYDLNVEPDIVQAGDPNLSRYKALLVPPLYSASDEVLQQVAEYVRAGGHVVMAFKSGFANQYSTVRHVMAPGPLRAAAGFRYQEFTSLAEPQRLTPDPYGVGGENTGSVWQEFLTPETADVVASFDHPYWRFPAITRNTYGRGTLTYQATVVTQALQRELVRDVLKRAGLTSPDHNLPQQGLLLHYYLNFSDQEHSITYPYRRGTDLLTDRTLQQGEPLTLKPWNPAVIAEHTDGVRFISSSR